MTQLHIPPSERSTKFCVLERPHGTVITMCVDWSTPYHWQGELIRTHHMEFRGGLASSHTGYRSLFSRALSALDTEDDLVDFALQVARQNFESQHHHGQFNLFDQTIIL